MIKLIKLLILLLVQKYRDAKGDGTDKEVRAEISRAVLNKIRQKNIAFAAAQKSQREHAAARGDGGKPA